MKETTVIALTKTQLSSWIADFNTNEYWLKKDLKPLVAFAQQHNQQHHKSVVVVQRALALEDFELTLHIAPTLQEAYDLIELDEIERDLWK